MTDYERGYAAALAEVRTKVEALDGEPCRPDLDGDFCDVHGELLYDGRCEDYPETKLAVLALLAAPAPSEPPAKWVERRDAMRRSGWPSECRHGLMFEHCFGDGSLAPTDAPAPSEPEWCTRTPGCLIRGEHSPQLPCIFEGPMGERRPAPSEPGLHVETLATALHEEGILCNQPAWCLRWRHERDAKRILARLRGEQR